MSAIDLWRNGFSSGYSIYSHRRSFSTSTWKRRASTTKTKGDREGVPPVVLLTTRKKSRRNSFMLPSPLTPSQSFSGIGDVIKNFVRLREVSQGVACLQLSSGKSLHYRS